MPKRTALLIGTLAGALAIVLADEPARPSLKVPVTKARVTRLTGLMDEDVWRTAASFTDFKLPDGGKSKVKALMAVTQDAKNLYLAVEVYEDPKTLKSLVAEALSRDAKEMWEDDRVEFFLDPAGKGKTYYQIAINSKGVVWDAYHAEPGNSDTSWNPVFKSRAAVGGASWIVQLALPWEMFDATPKFSDTWGFDAVITRAATREELWFSPIKGSAHQPDKFGALTGMTGTAPPDARERAPIIRVKPDPTTEPWFKEFEAREYKDKAGKSLLYRLLKPVKPDEDPPRSSLLIYLHGAGLRGDNNIDQVPEFHQLTIAAAEKYGALVVVPQCPRGTTWTLTAASRPASGPSASTQPQSMTPLKLLVELIPLLQKEFDVDPDRVYIAGGSMGGAGVYNLLAAHPEMFAAAVVFCGAGDPATAPKFARTPLWVFHGSRDRIIPVERAREMIAALKKADGKPHYTEIGGFGHDIGGPVLQEDELLPWLFLQKRPENAATQPASEPSSRPGVK
ncbi:MAG: sugar-binding protein [Phycisphaerae bacterium]